MVFCNYYKNADAHDYNVHELQQMDATPHEWVPGQIWHLHLAIDDATGSITGGWFDTQETLDGYYHVFHQILTDYGIPYKFFTDRRTVFTYKEIQLLQILQQLPLTEKHIR